MWTINDVTEETSLMESVQECIPRKLVKLPLYNYINSSNMNPLQIQKVASHPAIPVSGFLGACSVTSMMVQNTSNGNCTAKQVIKLHFWWFTPLFWHSLYVSWVFSLKHQGKKLKSKNSPIFFHSSTVQYCMTLFSFKYCSPDNMYYPVLVQVSLT